MPKNPNDDDSYSDGEAARRRDEVICRMANTSPQPKASPIPDRPQKKRKAAPRGVAGKGRARRET